MKIVNMLFIYFLSSFLLPINSLAADCDNLGEGTAWAACMNSVDLEKADKNLNISYRKLMKVLSQPSWREVKQEIIVEQRAWISLRDKECKEDQDLVGGAHEINLLECMKDMTIERTEHIQSLYEKYKLLTSRSSGTAAKGAAAP